MNEREQKDLIAYRIKRSLRSLQDARQLFDNNSFEGCINRLYYACFYTAGALLTTKNIIVKSHAGVKQMLGEHFIKSGEIGIDAGRFYSALFNFRQDSDYLDFAEVVKSLPVNFSCRQRHF
jgi:uncharacterized protein (UPF0332 family)